jgi:outer membrane beta-barrel protein
MAHPGNFVQNLFPRMNFLLFILLLNFGLNSLGIAADRIDVNALKQKYWETGVGDSLKVIQNRTYTKSGRLNFGILGGTISNDPFLNTYSYGAKLGFDFTEYLGINLTYLLASNTNSPAYDALVSVQGYGSNSNPLKAIYGAELAWSVLYGKVSVVGLSIIHFDLYLTGGIGSYSSQNGSGLVPWIGIGQQAFLNHWMSLSATYRFYRYVESVVELNRPGSIGNNLGNRTTYAGAVTLGLNFFLF